MKVNEPNSILVFSSAAHPVIIDEYNELRKHVKDITFFSILPPRQLLKECLMNTGTLLRKIKYLILFSELIFRNLDKFHFLLLVYWYFHLIYILVLDRSNNISIIHAHWLYPAGLIASVYSKYFPKKIVISTHGLDVDERTFGNSRLKRLFFDVAVQADWLITANYQIRDYLVNRGLKNVVLTNYFVDLDKFDNLEDDGIDLRETISVDKTSFLVVFGPRLKELYGAIDFVEAIMGIKTSIPNLFVVCLGDGHLATYVEEIFKKNDINFRLTGQISNKEAIRYLKSCDVFCYPCYTAHGISVLEAFACKKAVIGYKVSVPEIEDGSTGLLTELRDTEGLSKLILKLYNDTELRIRLGTNARQKLESKYPKEKKINDIVSCYNS